MDWSDYEVEGQLSTHGVNKRQMKILKILQTCKFVTTTDLSIKLNVTTRTLRYDIAFLKKAYPKNIVTYRGRYGGGVEWKE